MNHDYDISVLGDMNVIIPLLHSSMFPSEAPRSPQCTELTGKTFRCTHEYRTAARVTCSPSNAYRTHLLPQQLGFFRAAVAVLVIYATISIFPPFIVPQESMLLCSYSSYKSHRSPHYSYCPYNSHRGPYYSYCSCSSYNSTGVHTTHTAHTAHTSPTMVRTTHTAHTAHTGHHDHHHLHDHATTTLTPR